MNYLIDSDWMIDYIKARPSVVELIESLPAEEIAISLITYGEIYEGIYYGQERERDERLFQQFVRNTTVLPLTQAIMRRFAQIRGELRRAGLLIPDPDLMIAATALHHGSTLITRNTGHFARVRGLLLHEA